MVRPGGCEAVRGPSRRGRPGLASGRAPGDLHGRRPDRLRRPPAADGPAGAGARRTNSPPRRDSNCPPRCSPSTAGSTTRFRAASRRRGRCSPMRTPISAGRPRSWLARSTQRWRGSGATWPHWSRRPRRCWSCWRTCLRRSSRAHRSTGRSRSTTPASDCSGWGCLGPAETRLRAGDGGGGVGRGRNSPSSTRSATLLCWRRSRVACTMRTDMPAAVLERGGEAWLALGAADRPGLPGTGVDPPRAGRPRRGGDGIPARDSRCSGPNPSRCSTSPCGLRRRGSFSLAGRPTRPGWSSHQIAEQTGADQTPPVLARWLAVAEARDRAGGG